MALIQSPTLSTSNVNVKSLQQTFQTNRVEFVNVLWIDFVAVISRHTICLRKTPLDDIPRTGSPRN